MMEGNVASATPLYDDITTNNNNNNNHDITTNNNNNNPTLTHLYSCHKRISNRRIFIQPIWCQYTGSNNANNITQHSICNNNNNNNNNNTSNSNNTSKQ